MIYCKYTIVLLKTDYALCTKHNDINILYNSKAVLAQLQKVRLQNDALLFIFGHASTLVYLDKEKAADVSF